MFLGANGNYVLRVEPSAGDRLLLSIEHTTTATRMLYSLLSGDEEILLRFLLARQRARRRIEKAAE